MRIAVNTRSLITNKIDGIGRLTREVFSDMTRRHPEHEFIFIFDRPFPREFIFADNITPLATALPARHPVLWYLWFEYAVARLLKKHRADIFVSPDGFLPLDIHLPCIAMMHDINFYHYPKNLPRLYSLYYNYFFPKYARIASRIATVSSFSRNDIMEAYGLPPEKIDVIGCGCSSNFKPLDAAQQHAVRRMFTVGRPYFLYVGSLHPRKNIVGLLQAFDAFKTAYDSDIALILAGPAMFKTGDIQQAYSQMKHQADVLFTGQVSEEQLAGLYGAALALTFVPIFEGFGLPIIEAMNCHVPVIASNRTSMPEVCEKAALLVNPESRSEIVTAMASVAFNANLRAILIEAGRVRAQYFSWQKTSGLLWGCIQKALEENHA